MALLLALLLSLLRCFIEMAASQAGRQPRSQRARRPNSWAGRLANGSFWNECLFYKQSKQRVLPDGRCSIGPNSVPVHHSDHLEVRALWQAPGFVVAPQLCTAPGGRGPTRGFWPYFFLFRCRLCLGGCALTRSSFASRRIRTLPPL